MKSYKDLEIYQESLELFLATHRFSIKLPRYELYELGSQLRRSSDSVITNIVEGYGRRVYKNDFLKFLVYSHASNLETINHLEKISQLYAQFSEESIDLITKYDQLGARIYKFTEYVRENWR